MLLLCRDQRSPQLRHMCITERSVNQRHAGDDTQCEERESISKAMLGLIGTLGTKTLTVRCVINVFDR